MPLDDAACQREAQPRPLALRLGGEERLEDPGLDLRRDARAGVGDLDAHAPTRIVRARRETQPARRGGVQHRLTGVGDEIHGDLPQLVPVGPDEGQVVREIDADVDVGDP